MRIAAIIVLAAACVMPANAKAGSLDDLFRQFGLFGTWASDCGAAASPANPYVRVGSPTPDLVLETHDLGPKHVRNRYSVLSAERVAADEVTVHVVFRPGEQGEERQTLTFQVRDGTRRTLFNQTDGGPVRVKDGMVVGHEVMTPVLKKCD